jgi:hypothetical protein
MTVTGETERDSNHRIDFDEGGREVLAVVWYRAAW